MAFINISFDVLKVDEKIAKARFEKAIKTQINNAARAFVRAAAVRIPVDTGMAKGSLLHLGRLLRVAVDISPKPGSKKYQYPPRKGYKKSPELGEELTTSEIVNKGNLRYEFHFHTRIFHLLLNDMFGSPYSGAPWRAIEAGRIAFRNHMLNVAPNRMPGPLDFMLKSRHSIGRGGRLIKSDFKPVRQQKTVRGIDA